jgi:alkenylglycerophosphocholine hydrolase
MNNKQTLLFFMLATVFVLTRFIEPYAFSWLVKILPMLLLIGFAVKSASNASEKIFLSGLIFSALGDFFLDYDRLNWFIFGLGSFLFAHIFYMLSLKPLARNIAKKHIKIIAMYCIYGAAMFSLIASGLGELFIPVLVYMSVLLLMAITTLISEKSNNWLIIGGLSFVLSDSMLGINKFYAPIPYASVFIMISYYFAQYALVNGMFAHLNKTK